MASNRDREVLEDVARLADNLGPALVPAGHEELVRSITAVAKSLFEAAACSVALLTEDQSELVFYVASGAGAENVEGMRIPSDQGIAGWVVTSGQPIAIDDVRQDPRFAQSTAQSTGYVPKSILAMPLETGREMLGCISVLDRQTEGMANRDMELLGLFARQAALAIENTRVFTSLGKALFQTVGRYADNDEDLQRTLLRVSEDSGAPDDELAELAAHFHLLGKEGPEERRAATRLLGDFVAYIQARSRY